MGEAPRQGTGTDGRVMAWARLAGLGYLVIIASGIFAEFFVRSSLLVPGDPAATAANLQASGTLYRVGIASEFLMLTADVVVAGALWVVFRPVSRGLALLAAFFRLAHAAIVGVNLLNLWVPLVLLAGGAPLAAFTPDQLAALALVFLETHGYGYAVGLLFFAAHCLLLGWLVLRSGYVPRVLGGLLVVAAVGYLADTLARTLLADYAAFEGVFTAVVFTPAFVAELSFCLWLLVKGVRIPELRRPA